MTDWPIKAQNRLSRFNKVMAIIASFLFVLIMLMTVLEVILRYLFKSPTVWTLETSQYLMLIATFLGAAYTLEIGAHIKVEFIVDLLSDGKKKIANIISSIFAIIFFAVLLWKSYELFWFNYEFSAVSFSMLAIPLSPIYFFMPIGSFFMLLQGIMQLIFCLKK